MSRDSHIHQLQAALRVSRGWIITCSESAQARRDLKTVDAALAFRDADRAEEGGEPVHKLHKFDFADLRLKDGYVPAYIAGWNCALDRVASLNLTPATPLLDDETVERCAVVAEASLMHRRTAETIATAIRVLKGSAK